MNVYPSRWLGPPRAGAHTYVHILAPGWEGHSAKVHRRELKHTYRQEAQLASTLRLEPHGGREMDLNQRARGDFLLCTFSQVHSAQSHVYI